MNTIIKNGCGLDVHQASITACIIRTGIKKQIKEFGTMTKELKSLKDWLHQNKVTHVAMESTGIYWQPVMNIIGQEFNTILANARHIKNVPGRKTDVQDAEWICKLLRAGLLNKSFIPPKKIVKLRNLTRYQKKLKYQERDERSRVHKVLQQANIKLTTVLSDIFGVAGLKILKDLARGITDPKELSKHIANSRYLYNKQDQAIEALEGKLTEEDQFMLEVMLENIFHIQNQILVIDKKITLLMKDYQKDHELLQTIPGIGEKSANTIVSEIGVNMDVFPSASHLSSWAGLSPTNNESAGKKKSSKIGKGNKCLKSMLVECAWCSVRKKDHYLRSKYYKLVPRMGKKKALVAIAHKILEACYYVLKHQKEYKELGASYLDKNNANSLLRHYTKKLTSLGFDVELKPLEIAA
jgi:transposase